MTDDALSEILSIHGGRLVADGLPEPDLREAEATLDRWEGWFDFWARKADGYELLAGKALKGGRRRSAGELYWFASIAAHYGQFLWFHRPEEREEGQRRKQHWYQEAAPLLRPPAERFEVVVDGVVIPGYIRLPEDLQGPVGCVVLIGGLESTKEESYRFENLCLERGIATCIFDGPGQGEAYFHAKLRPDFERFTSAVLDYVSGQPQIDAGRLGLLGRSLGGYYAVRSACSDHRVRAVVAWGAMFDMSYFKRLHRSAQIGFAYVAGYDDLDAAACYLGNAIDLSDCIGELRADLYVLHGGADVLIPVEQVERLRAGLHPDVRVTWDVPAEGNHCCHNLSHLIRPRMADWLADRLGGIL